MKDRDHVILVVVDVQERMMPVIDGGEAVTRNILRLVDGFTRLGIPMLVTEQYPKGLGTTIPTVREAMGQWYRPIEKMSFSACGELRFMQQLEAAGRQRVIVCGVETHVCIYQTARDMRELGWDVEVVADAVGSRAAGNYDIALTKLARHEVELTSVEMILFELMGRADIPEFKAVSAIVK